MRLSPSSLDRYRQCPLSFRLIDLDRVRRAVLPNGQLVLGNAVHGALERFYGLAVYERTVENAERALRHVWPQYRSAGAFLNREEEAACGTQALNMLRQHVLRYSTDVVVLAREQWVETQVAEGVQVFGKIDRVDQLDAGGLRVVDYKTGKLALEVGDLPHESAVQVYVCAAEATFQRPVEEVVFSFLAAGEDLVWWPERDDVETLGDKLRSLGAAIAADAVFEAMPGTQCRFCPAALSCPDRAVVNVEDLVLSEEVPF